MFTDLLLHRIWKARYFPRKSFLDADLGFRPSYTWRSVWGTLDTIRDGLRWRVGNGERIRIWQDAWLPGRGDGVLRSSPSQMNSSLTWVAELINQDTKQWDKAVISQAFDREVGKAIMLIPLSWRTTTDRMFWNWSNNGFFTVKSAYHRVRELTNANIASNSSGNSFPWKKLWSAGAPSKVKHFVYKMVTNTLPSRTNLRKRGVQVDTQCPLCSSPVEEMLRHLFMECNWTRAAWFSHPLCIHSDAVEGPPRDWLADCMVRYTAEQLPLIMQGFYGIWKAQNEACFSSIIADPSIAMSNSLTALADWDQAQSRRSSEHVTTRSNDRWQPSPQGQLKANVDAGWTGDTSTGYGMAVRKHTGEFMFAATHVEELRHDATVAEALGLRWCLATLIEMGVDTVMVEMDASVIVHAMKSGNSNPQFAAIIEDCRDLVPCFQRFNISHAKRTANVVAHTLAAKASDFNSFSWWDYPPSCIAHSLLADSAFSD